MHNSAHHNVGWFCSLFGILVFGAFWQQNGPSFIRAKTEGDDRPERNLEQEA